MIKGVVLLVEDSAVVQLDMEQELLSHGASHVVIVGDVESALEYFNSQTCELLISEWEIEGESCMPVLEKAKERGVSYIVATGVDISVATDEVLNGITVLQKPFSPLALQKALELIAQR